MNDVSNKKPEFIDRHPNNRSEDTRRRLVEQVKSRPANNRKKRKRKLERQKDLTTTRSIKRVKLSAKETVLFNPDMIGLFAKHLDPKTSTQLARVSGLYRKATTIAQRRDGTKLTIEIKSYEDLLSLKAYIETLKKAGLGRPNVIVSVHWARFELHKNEELNAIMAGFSKNHKESGDSIVFKYSRDIEGVLICPDWADRVEIGEIKNGGTVKLPAGVKTVKVHDIFNGTLDLTETQGLEILEMHNVKNEGTVKLPAKVKRVKGNKLSGTLDLSQTKELEMLKMGSLKNLTISACVKKVEICYLCGTLDLTKAKDLETLKVFLDDSDQDAIKVPSSVKRACIYSDADLTLAKNLETLEISETIWTDVSVRVPASVKTVKTGGIYGTLDLRATNIRREEVPELVENVKKNGRILFKEEG